MALYNKAMSEVRIAVEMLFGNISNYFKFIDFIRQMKVNLSPVGKMYVVYALLENAQTCLYGTVAHNCHGKIFLLTTKSISPRQNQFPHGKIDFLTAKSISPWQSQFDHGKINFTIRQNQFYHGKIIFIYGKINFTTAKSFSSTAK